MYAGDTQILVVFMFRNDKKNVHFSFLHSSSLNFNGENKSFYETSPWPSKMR